MLDLERFKVAVFVFGMNECPACEMHIPRVLQRLSERQAAGEPWRIYDPETESANPIPNGAIPVLFLDLESSDKTINELADRLFVSGTPCTAVLPRGVGGFKVEGALAIEHIDQILDAALERSK